MLRIFDFLFSLFGLILGGPVLVMIYVIGLFDTGSPIFRQERVGRDQKPFTLVKFRTMRPDTASVASHLADASAITSLGAFLRRTKLDELPQLWNVLIGDMSLVGPRPMMTSQQALYPSTVYYEMRPGITGYWQVSARNESSFADRAVFDSAYDADLSLATDLRVLWRTVHTVTNGTGY